MAYSATDSQDEAIQRTLKRNKMLAYAAQNAPPLTTGRPTLDARGAPQSQPAQGAPSIIPPMQPDWSAAFAPKGAPAPAPPGGFGAVRMAERGGMDQPAVNPGGFGAVRMAERGGVDQPAVNPQRAAIEEKRRLGELRNARMRMLWDGSGGLDPEAKAARIAAIQGTGAQIENIEGANRPVQSPLSGEQIQASHTDTGRMLKIEALKRREAIAKAMKADPAHAAALQDDLYHTFEMERDADTKFAPYSQEQLAQKIDAGQRSAAIAGARKGAYTEMAGEDAKRHLAAVMHAREMAGKRAELEGAGADTAIAQTKQAGAEATIGADPKVIESNIKARQFQAAAAAAAAAAAKAKTEAGAYEGGAPTAQGAAIDQQRRAAARSLAGIGSDAEYNHFITQATGHLNALGSLTDGDRALANFQAQTLPVLQQIAALDPDEAARIARDLIGRIPSNAVTPGDLLTGPLGTFGIMRKGVANRRFLAVHRALDEIARGAAGGGLAQ